MTNDYPGFADEQVRKMERQRLGEREMEPNVPDDEEIEVEDEEEDEDEDENEDDEELDEEDDE